MKRANGNVIRDRVKTAVVLARNAVLGMNIAALSLANRPRLVHALLQYNLFTWRSLRNEGLPLLHFSTLYPDLEETDVTVPPNAGVHLKSWDAVRTKDMLFLALFARAQNPDKIFEIGTFHGYSARIFALNSPAGAAVYTLDLPADESASLPSNDADVRMSKHRYAEGSSYAYQRGDEAAAAKVQQLYGDSALFDFEPFYDDVDLFFIDGAHSYDYVRSDTLQALKCVREGGVILWHDYGRLGFDDVTKWLDEFQAKGYSVYRLPGSSVAFLQVSEKIKTAVRKYSGYAG